MSEALVIDLIKFVILAVPITILGVFVWICGEAGPTERRKRLDQEERQ